MIVCDPFSAKKGIPSPLRQLSAAQVPGLRCVDIQPGALQCVRLQQLGACGCLWILVGGRSARSRRLRITSLALYL